MIEDRSLNTPSTLNLLSVIVGVATLFVSVMGRADHASADDVRGDAARVIGVAEFIARVKASNPDELVRQTAVDVASAAVVAARRLDNPAVAYDREAVFDRGQGLAENSIQLAFPIDISGRRGLSIRSAETGVSAAKLEIEAARIEFLADALKVYFRTAALKERARLQGESRGALSALIKTVQDRAEGGDASGADRLRVELELCALDESIAETRREITRGRMMLGALAGAPGTALDPSELPEPVSALQSDPNESSSIHPGVTAAARHAEAFDTAQDAAGRKRVPSLLLTGGMKTAAQADDTLFGYTAGIALSLPFFDNGRGEREQAAAEAKRARAQKVAAEHRIAAEVATARAVLREVAAQERHLKETQLVRIGQLLESVEIAFKEGERPVFELLDAHRIARELRLRHLELVLTAQLTLIELNAALGRVPGETP